MATNGIEAVFLETQNWGTQEMTVRVPDGRLWSVQAPAGS
jgi:hypothetical protein